MITVLTLGGLAALALARRGTDAPVWHEGFEQRGLALWKQVHRATPDRLRFVTRPTREGDTALRLTTADGDVAPRTPTDNPRSQLNSGYVFREGDDAFIGWSTYLPRSFPARLAPWMVFFQFHGSPYTGSPRLSFSADSGKVTLNRDARYGYDAPWSMPLQRGRWMDFALHVRWSRDASKGSAQLWLDGRRQRFRDGSTTLRMATIKADQRTVEIIPTNYRKRGTDRGSVSVYLDALSVGHSLDAVRP